MYIDLDNVFQPQFGKIVEKLRTRCVSRELWNFGFSTRDTMLHLIGGWRDLNFGEDWEMVYRAIRNGVSRNIILTYSFMENLREALLVSLRYRLLPCCWSSMWLGGRRVLRGSLDGGL